MTKEYFDMADHEFDNTKTHDFRKCPALGYWKWVRRLESVYQNSDLLFGTACHESLAVWNEAILLGKVQRMEPALDRLNIEMAVIEETKGSKDLQTAEKLINQAIIVPDVQGQITAVEKRYERQLYYDHQTKKNVIYFGKVDLRLTRNNIDYVLDYKSTGNLRSTFFDSFYLSNQPRGYCWLTGARNFIVVVLHAIKSKCAYSGQAGPCVHTQDYFYEDEEIDRWGREIQTTIRDIYRKIVEVKNGDVRAYSLFPRYATQCQPPGYGCLYQRLCEQPCEAEDAMIDYTVYKRM